MPRTAAERGPDLHFGRAVSRADRPRPSNGAGLHRDFHSQHVRHTGWRCAPPAACATEGFDPNTSADIGLSRRRHTAPSAFSVVLAIGR